jgi:cobyrinic acid a,c-diamide synthase
MQIPRLIIASPSSGSGKSLVASGLMAAFARQMTVQGFKVGPDYIDPMYHTAAAGRPSRNLDTWMLPREAVRRGFGRACRGADLAVIEGVMGLFDGYDADPLNGSAADVAYLLDAPVVLVIDCSRMSGSAAAVAHGFNTFIPEVRLSGVICNRAGSQRHAAWLREGLARAGLPVLGCIPRLPDLKIPERHLGLFTVAERPQAVRAFLNAAADAMQQYLDLPGILNLAAAAAPLDTIQGRPDFAPSPDVRLAVAMDEAFCFYYEDNLDELRRAGAEIVPFSPLRDQRLPPNVSGLYLGGGYPELYAPQLSANRSMLADIRSVHRMDMPIYAECGGLMFLTEGFHQENGDFALVGALPGWCRMGERLTMGYRMVETLRSGLLGAAGQNLRGHEFHYSQWEMPAPHQASYRVSPRSDDEQFSLDGYAQGNLQAAYIHLHFGQKPELADQVVKACREWRRRCGEKAD